MIHIDSKDNRSQIVPLGDSGMFTISLQEVELPEGAIGIFAVCDKRGRTIFKKVIPVVDNSVTVRLTNQETRDFKVGSYIWDLRIVTDPDYGPNGVISADDDSDEVHSIFAYDTMPNFIVKSVVVDV